MPDVVRSGLTTLRGWTLAKNRYSPQSREYLEQLCSHERWTRGQIAENQLKSLQRMLDISRQSCAFYRHYPALKLTALSDWAQVPLLTRAQIRENNSLLINQSVPTEEQIIVATTG